ncbi:unnamed protein product [Phytophthora fragariaefolia]|uniref:Unnamed protein product n=1 Tax=Phytophthora fragariaefolia TaxID=1490495 RepID=A0A9W7D1N9_9STRA|nr:unnamed protein product [Phytophthora fragariaefolia]
MWEATQVELHGSYSTARVTDLAKGYSEQQTVLGAGVLLLRGDDVPRYSPISYRGTDSAVVSYETGHSRLVGGGSIDCWHSIRSNLWIGFPVPFTTLVLVPVWLPLTTIPMGIQWAKDLMQNWRAVMMLIDMVKLWLCDFLLVFIYPPYFYGFTAISNQAKLIFTLLLPAIKLFMRNLFARAVGHLGDETPVLVIFNADVFGSLFIAYCMQSSPSFWTTIELMVVDIWLMWLSLRDIEKARKGLSELERKVDDNAMWSSYHGAVGHISLGGRMPTTLERASILLEREAQSHVGGSRSSQLLELQRVLSHEKQEREGPKLVALEGRKSLNKSIIMMMKDIRNSLRRIYPTDHEVRGVVKELKGDERATGSRTLISRYKGDVFTMVYSCCYVAVAIYLVTTYHLPNRNYYAIYDGIDENDLIQTLNNVVFYCMLQLVSLVLLSFMLRRMLGLSPIQVIAFVLEKQVDYVQMCLIFWLFYNVQSAQKDLGT